MDQEGPIGATALQDIPAAPPPEPGAWPLPLGAAGIAALLQACGGGGGGGDAVAPAPAPGASPAPAPAPGTAPSPSPAPAPAPSPAPAPAPGPAPAPSPSPAPAPATAPTATEAARFLAQATLGAPKSEILAVQAQGYAAWLDAQFQKPRSQSHFEWLLARGYDASTFSGNASGLDNTIWRKLVTSDDGLRQRVTLALSELLVVSVLGVSTFYRQFAVANYLDILEANAFGNYRTLLGDVTRSTAMGYYLTFRGNAKANAQGAQPDENYARELMQLFTIGLVQLNPDGTPTANAAETYGPGDVTGLARVFTGWDLDTSGFTQPLPPEVHRRPMIQIASRYETGLKIFLGITIPTGTPAQAALDTALDTLFQHPNCPPFVCRQLIQRLVTSNPSPAYVGRVAAVFVNNGAGTRGDLKAVVRAILLDPEARAAPAATATQTGKLREPVQRFLNWARAYGLNSPSGAWALGDTSDPGTRLGQSPMRASSVFNFFRPGYVPPNSSIAQSGLVGPEFQITTETSVAGYVNYMQSMLTIATNPTPGGTLDVRADHTSLLALAGDSQALLAEVNLVIAAGQVSAATLATLKSAIDTLGSTTDADRRNRVNAAILLVMATPEYIVQK